ncbi:MAG: MFS transporter, partial [candidate division NC10 bacterium]
FVKEFGGDYAATASLFSLVTAFYGVSSILVGHLVDRFGPRRIVLVGGVVLPLALIGSGSAQALWHLYLTHGILSAFGLAATSHVPVSLVLLHRYPAQRGLAYGVASAGVGIGILLFVPLTQVLMDLWGWRVAYRVVAILVSLVILSVGTFVLREGRTGLGPDADEAAESAAAFPRAANPPKALSLAAALSSREFWLVVGTYVLLNGPTQMVLTHHVAYLVDAGQSRMLAAAIVGLVGLLSVPAKIGWGVLSDRVWLEWIYVGGGISLVAAVGALLAIGPASAAWLLYAYAALVASGYAVSAALNPILSSRFFSGPHFGVILGILATFYHGAAAIAIWAAGYAHDLSGTYRLPLLGAAVSVCLAIGCVCLAAPRRGGR